MSNRKVAALHPLTRATPSPLTAGPRDFHLRARAEAEGAVHSRRVSGLVAGLLLLVTAAYGVFAWQSDRPAPAVGAEVSAPAQPAR